MNYVNEKEIAEVLTTMVSKFDDELFALSEQELSARWYFNFDKERSVAWNIYRFSDTLENYKYFCRLWEEHHNGNCCVVERVRDKYLMPRVKQFLIDLQADAELTSLRALKVTTCAT